jgi:uncharacterized membrane protein (UPF0136 family)
MIMKLILTIGLFLGFLNANAQIERLTGPRVGATFITEGSAADVVNDGIDFDNNNMFGSTGTAFTSQYGWQWETRFADDGGDVVGIVEWIVLVAGMEKGRFLPSASSLIGARTSKGLEFAIGPNLSLAGVSMAVAVGYNFTSGKLNIPVNLAFVPGIKRQDSYFDLATGNDVNYDYNTGSRISLIIGFNLSNTDR